MCAYTWLHTDLMLQALQVDGALSVRCYLQALVVCYEGLLRKQAAEASRAAVSGQAAGNSGKLLWFFPRACRSRPQTYNNYILEGKDDYEMSCTVMPRN